ncbi:MAG: hypothetical protein HY658_13615 [Actinobacteria bacterium]|nr:hypothetical protein [Actinomycetota bacterium]
MNRATWLVLLLGADEAGLDSERLQMGLFLLAKRGVVPEDARYSFQPYIDGPIAPEVYRDLEALVESGLVLIRGVAGSRWRELHLTLRGRIEARTVAGGVDPRTLARIRVIRDQVSGATFRRVVESVLTEHPEYRHRRAAGF